MGLKGNGTVRIGAMPLRASRTGFMETGKSSVAVTATHWRFFAGIAYPSLRFAGPYKEFAARLTAICRFCLARDHSTVILSLREFNYDEAETNE
tara:strand:+ start:322 stop:603 length:282 start_codon:yes stop_codon:yes gene_type:complete